MSKQGRLKLTTLDMDENDLIDYCEHIRDGLVNTKSSNDFSSNQIP